eukprot:gene11627-8015_t
MAPTSSSSKSAPKNISVFLRVRPPVPREKNHTFNNIAYNPSDNRVITVHRPSGSKKASKDYIFNRVFQPSSSQQEVYQAFAEQAVGAAFSGEHGNEGVLQQAMHDTWDRIRKDTAFDYQCSVSYVQLYNEILTDLLDDKKGRVRIQMGPEGRGDVVLVSEASGVGIEVPVKGYDDTMNLFRSGMKRKEMTSTAMNATSSRSHTIFTFNIHKTSKTGVVQTTSSPTTTGGSAADVELEAPKVALEGRLVLCDLAGSERVSKTHAEGKALGEATHINGSLLVLGKVVAALTEKNSQHAPFRESKLTRILQYSLLGNGNTSLVVNCSPSDDNTEETLSAIFFGQRAIQIKQETKRHEILDYKALYLQLMADIDSKRDHVLADVLDEEKSMYEDRIKELESQCQLLQQENQALRDENTALKGNLSPEQLAQMGKGGEWKDMVRKLKQTLDGLNAKHNALLKEHQQLALVCAEAKTQLFTLGKRTQCIRMQYSVDYTRLTKRIDELTSELCAAKGTEYISTDGASASSPSTQHNRAASFSGRAISGSGGMDTGSGIDENTPIEQELIKAREEISHLRRELDDMMAYHKKSVQAIRFLAGGERGAQETLAVCGGELSTNNIAYHQRCGPEQLSNTNDHKENSSTTTGEEDNTKKRVRKKREVQNGRRRHNTSHSPLLVAVHFVSPPPPPPPPFWPGLRVFVLLIIPIRICFTHLSPPAFHPTIPLFYQQNTEGERRRGYRLPPLNNNNNNARRRVSLHFISLDRLINIISHEPEQQSNNNSNNNTYQYQDPFIAIINFGSL